MEQTVLHSDNNFAQLTRWFDSNGVKKLFLVCDGSFGFIKGIGSYLDALTENGIQTVKFDRVAPNPTYESVVEAVDAFLSNECDAIFAVGGGSAIDVAKCVKLYRNMDRSKNYLDQELVPASLPFVAMPTTAGTGSEATRYAVIYYRGEKQSVTSEACIPDAVLFDPDVLMTLPTYQKKSTAMDAFCHAVESFWSVNSTQESREYSYAALRLIVENLDGYLDNSPTANKNMLLAANTAGKAINITQTTAGHAMCYKITSLFGVSHGHAAILCDRVLFPYMLNNLDRCIDSRGSEYLGKTLSEMAACMGCDSAEQAVEFVNRMFDRLQLSIPSASEEQLDILCSSVNPVRLKNHPVLLDAQAISQLYHKILRCEQ